MSKKKTQSWIQGKVENTPMNRAARRSYFKQTGRVAPIRIKPFVKEI